MNFWQYIATNYTEILALLLEHIKLTAISVGLAVLIGVPPVSYTHLDVYKRQIYRCPFFWAVVTKQ